MRGVGEGALADEGSPGERRAENNAAPLFFINYLPNFGIVSAIMKTSENAEELRFILLLNLYFLIV